MEGEMGRISKNAMKYMAANPKYINIHSRSILTVIFSSMSTKPNRGDWMGKPMINSSNNVMKNYKFTALIGIIFLVAALSISEAQNLKVENLQTEYRVNPVGIDVKKPRFSWIIRTDERNILQNAYRLQIAKGEVNFEMQHN
jgi:hypothetical protein